jgi:hypothetical protein
MRTSSNNNESEWPASGGAQIKRTGTLDIFFDPVVPQYQCSLGRRLRADQLTLIVGTPESRSGRTKVVLVE